MNKIIVKKNIFGSSGNDLLKKTFESADNHDTNTKF